MNGHALRVEFDGWLRVEAVCHEGAGADCRLTSVSCECEEWGKVDRRDDGSIWHWVVGEGPIEPLWHEVKPADYCNICEFLNNDGDLLELATKGTHFQIADIPIKPVWDGYGYEWERLP